MFEFLVADAGDAAEFTWRGRARGRDSVDRGIMQHDIGWHAALARHVGTPSPERCEQRWIVGLARASGCGNEIATTEFGSAGANARAWGFLAQHHLGLAFQDAARALGQLQRAKGFAVG